MIKKTTLAVTIMVAVIFFTQQTSGSMHDLPLNEYLITKSMELTRVMNELAASDEYLDLMSSQLEFRDIIKQMGADVSLEPKSAVIITVPDTAVDSIIQSMAGELNLSRDAYGIVKVRMLSSIPAMINSVQGVGVLATTSMLSVSKAFQQHEDLTASTYVVLFFDGYESIVFFNSYDENVTSASASFILFEEDIVNAAENKVLAGYILGQYGIDSDEIKVEYVDGNVKM